MGIANTKATEKSDFELLFVDSPSYFCVYNAKMIFEGPMVRFICFNMKDELKEEQWYPIARIHRIKRYAEKKA
jgi:hypothetical protein